MRAGARGRGKWMAAALTSTAETSRRDHPGKQNSLKQLNVTQEKINNGKEESQEGGGEKKKKEEEGDIPLTRQSLRFRKKNKKGAWFLLRLLKQREIYRIELIYRPA